MNFLQMIRDKEPNARITIENKIDYAPEPENFTYISENMPTGKVVISSTPILYCSCDENCKDSKACCPSQNNNKLAYNEHKRLRLDKKTAIIECNSLCKCSSECINRVVQLGIKVPLCLFKTASRGWGVKALQAIPK